MKTWLRLGIVLAALCLMALGAVSAAAQDSPSFEETVVTLDGGISATLVQPAGEGPFPAVLMLHGFGSSKDEVGNMYLNLAAALGNEGIASLRIDFRGWGESEGEMVDSSVDGMVADAETAYAYLTSLDFVDADKIGLMGFSLGGWVSVFTAGEHPDWFETMAIWSSGTDLKGVFLGSLGQENFDAAAANGSVEIDLGWRMVTLGEGFFTSLETYNTEEQFAKYDGSFFVVAGTEDFSGADLDWFLTHATGELRAGYLVRGADHTYLVLTEDQTVANEVIARTAAWFKMSLG
ncbi:MAG: alpha/beta fold hydrolase [Anaerolineae bacterium]|nr:alpha/beta fold hydrolase [Anaerolineae bacterium]